jgi:CheY-like chemotaxis protein
VFVNLLINAAQAITDPIAERNEIRVRCSTNEAGCALIEVSDTGRGIAPENMSRIFEPFFTTKPVGVGTGLGLSICHGIVTQLGGEIQVESRLGRGSTFRVLLPPCDDAARLGGRERRGEEPPGSRGRVLVIDDEPMVGAAVARTLAPHHDVTTVSTARAALEHLEADPRFDVVLCDLMMPGMTGMELHARLSASAPALTERMIFLTGGAFTPHAREFLDRVPNPRLEKPFESEALRSVVSALVYRAPPASTGQDTPVPPRPQ